MQSDPARLHDTSAIDAGNSPLFIGSFVAIVLLAALVRFAAADCDLWFDEIWTLQLIRDDAGSSGVLGPSHNNNHPLNTWILQWVGDHASSFTLHRLHSVIAGVGAVLLGGLIGRRRGRVEAVLAALLIGSSYLLIHYSSEARGYSMMIFFVLAAFYALQSWLLRPRPATLAIFWLSCVLASLSHLFSVQFFFAAGIWSLAVGGSERGALRRVRDASLLFGPIALFLVWMYVSFVGVGGELHGGAVATGGHAASVIQAVSLAVGGPSNAGGTALFATGVAAGLLLAGLFQLRDDPQREWLFYALVCFGSPAILLWVNDPWALFTRYFLISSTFFLLLVAFVCAAQMRTKAGRALGIAAISIYLVGNGLHTNLLLRYGHGQYLAALEYMAIEGRGKAITIGSDHPFRNRMLIRYYAEELPDYDFRYVSEGAGPPEWFVVHHEGSRPGRGLEAFAYEGREYRLDRIYKTTDLAGFDWRVYRRGAVAAAE